MPITVTQTDTETRYKIGYTPHRWQSVFHASTKRDRAAIAGIRGGKTTGGSNEFLRMVTAGAPGVSLVTGPDMPTIKQTTIETIRNGMGPNKIGQWPEGLIESFNKVDLVLKLIDGNRVLFRSADDPDSLRGPAAKHAWVDEVTLCKDGTLGILQGRTLDTGGRIIATGTPKGTRNWFYQSVLSKCSETVPGRVWENDRWCVVQFPSRDNVGLAHALLQERYEIDKDGERWKVVERSTGATLDVYATKYDALHALSTQAAATLGEEYDARFKAQELEGLWVDWTGAAFNADALTRCFGLPVTHYGRPVEKHRAYMGFDPAGLGKDFRVATVVCIECRAVVDQWREQRGPFARMYDAVAELAKKWQPITLEIDETSMGGEAIKEELESTVAQVSRNTLVEGYVFNTRSKYALLTRLAARLEEGLAIDTAKTEPLAFELRNYNWDDADLQTDCVMGLALAVWPLSPLVARPEQAPVVRARHASVAGPRTRIDWDSAEVP